MFTEKDLLMRYHKDTGKSLSPFSLVNKEKSEDYFKWVEEKYLEKLNEEEFINQIFTDE